MDAQEALQGVLKMGSLGNSELPHDTKDFPEYEANGLDQVFAWISPALGFIPKDVPSPCAESLLKKKSAVLTNHKMYLAPTLTHVVKPFSIILCLLPFHNFHFPVGP